MTRYLITGWLSFIEKNLASKLANNKYEVTILNNSVVETEIVFQDLYFFNKGDALDENQVFSVMRNKDGCFYLASLFSAIVADKNHLVSHDANVISNLSLLMALEIRSDKILFFLVYLLSSTEYGDNACMPYRTIDYLRPINAFYAYKNCCENHTGSSLLRLETPSVCFILFNLYVHQNEPNDYGNNIVSLSTKIIKFNCASVKFVNEKQLRNFFYIDDLMEISIRSMKMYANSASIFKLWTSYRISINHLADILITIFALPVSINYLLNKTGDVLQLVGNQRKAATVLDYRAVTSIGNGLKYACHNYNTEFVFKKLNVSSTRSLFVNF